MLVGSVALVGWETRGTVLAPFSKSSLGNERIAAVVRSQTRARASATGLRNCLALVLELAQSRTRAQPFLLAGRASGLLVYVTELHAQAHNEVGEPPPQQKMNSIGFAVTALGLPVSGELFDSVHTLKGALKTVWEAECSTLEMSGWFPGW